MAENEITRAIQDHMKAAGVPLTEFDPKFVVRMVNAMMVSFHKYGRVADAYPLKFDAGSDVRARMAKYRETGNKHFLVDAANFAMIETMHPGRDNAAWGTNDAADSPGRTSTANRKLVQEDNAGGRIMGETILHHPSGDLCGDCPPINSEAATGGLADAFRPMDEWDDRDEPVLLLVDYRDGGEHPIEDCAIGLTIGHNNDHNTPDEQQGWRFAGWCWSHDHYTEGKGVPIAWKPLTEDLFARSAASLRALATPSTSEKDA